jgi:hypothetical protein
VILTLISAPPDEKFFRTPRKLELFASLEKLRGLAVFSRVVIAIIY